MRTRIGTQLIVGAGAVSALTVGALSLWLLRTHRTALLAELQRSADQLSETIKSATLHDMLENRRDNIDRQVDTIGRQQGIVAVRIYNKEGRIVFSSVKGEKGQAVDKRAEACYACHAEGRPLTRLPIPERARVFRASDGQAVLGIINPIHNQASCVSAECHAHRAEDTVLGILDLSMSLTEVDRGIALSQRRIALAALLTVGLSGLILWWLNRRLVVRPVAVLAAATRRVADGDLTTRIPVSSGDELGALARAFNEMTGRLAEDQRQLTQAEKLASVGRLAAGVAHEINNPLTGVLSYSSLLLKRAQNDPDLRSDLEVIVRETKRCREIVKGLLNFARQSPPHRQPTDLNEVVRLAVAIVTNQLALDRVSLSLDLALDLPQLAADANQLQQVVVNLLVNAADAVEASGTIRVLTRRAAGQDAIEIIVEDSGRGIAAEQLPHIFEPFFSTKGPRGTGLGLAVSWGIVQGHGGTIHVVSRIGEGSRFTVRLPLGKPDQRASGTQ